MSRPTFVLVHGAWHTPACWSRLIRALEARGYGAVAPHLPSSGSIPVTKDWSPDIEVLRTTVSDIVRERDVVVVAHSNGGLFAGQGLEGLDKQSCADEGWKGGVVRLVFVAAFLVPEGFRHSAPGTRENMIETMRTDLDAGVVTVNPEDVKAMMYQDVDDDEVAEIAKTLVPQSLGPYYCTTTYAAWRWIPTTYVVTLGDAPTTLATEEYLVKAARESEPNRIERVVRREVGHAPFWSQVEWTADLLVEEAGGEKLSNVE